MTFEPASRVPAETVQDLAFMFVFTVTVCPAFRLISRSKPLGLEVPAFPAPHSALAVSVLVLPTIESFPVVDVIHAAVPDRVEVDVPGIVPTVPVYARSFPFT